MIWRCLSVSFKLDNFWIVMELSENFFSESSKMSLYEKHHNST